jgi:hypothetical protein
LQQDLIAEASDHAQAEDFRIKAFGTREISYVKAEMVKAFKFHWGNPQALAWRGREKSAIKVRIISG